MNFDDLTDLWKQQPAPPARPWEATLAEVRKGTRKFDRTILWRDLREGIACVVVAVFFGQAAWEGTGGHSLALWIATLLPLGVIGFLCIDRLRHSHLRPAAGEPLVVEIQRTIARLRHQEHLLRNVVWWYLLPLGMAGTIYGMDAVISADAPWHITLIDSVFLIAFLVGVNVWIYRLNQRAIVKEIQPEISKLEITLNELSSETPQS